MVVAAWVMAVESVVMSAMAWAETCGRVGLVLAVWLLLVLVLVQVLVLA